MKKNYSRGARHERTKKQYDHIKANESTRHAKKKNFFVCHGRWHRDNQYRKSRIAVGWTEEHCQHLDSLVAIDFSYTATRKERQRYENNNILGVNDQGPKPRPMKKITDLAQAVNKLLVLQKAKWRIQIRISLNMYDSDSDQSKNVKEWNRNGNVGDGTIGLKLLPPLQPGGRHKNGKNIIIFLRVEERTTVICFSRSFAYKNWRFPCKLRGV